MCVCFHVTCDFHNNEVGFSHLRQVYTAVSVATSILCIRSVRASAGTILVLIFLNVVALWAWQPTVMLLQCIPNGVE